MSDYGCRSGKAKTGAEGHALGIEPVLNATMFAVEGTAGRLAGSSSLLADALDMLTDGVAWVLRSGCMS